MIFMFSAKWIVVCLEFLLGFIVCLSVYSHSSPEATHTPNLDHYLC